MNRSTWFSRGRTPARADEGATPDAARRRRQTSSSVWFRRVAAGAAFVIPVAMAVPVTAQAVAPPGNGFVVTAGDLSFILKQIKIAERHSATLHADQPVRHPGGPCPDQIPDRLTSYGLRTVDGSCNNLFPGRETFAAADQPFPRLAPAEVPRRRADHAGLPGRARSARRATSRSSPATSSSTRSRGRSAT